MLHVSIYLSLFLIFSVSQTCDDLDSLSVHLSHTFTFRSFFPQQLIGVDGQPMERSQTTWPPQVSVPNALRSEEPSFTPRSWSKRSPWAGLSFMLTLIAWWRLDQIKIRPSKRSTHVKCVKYCINNKEESPYRSLLLWGPLSALVAVERSSCSPPSLLPRWCFVTVGHRDVSQTPAWRPQGSANTTREWAPLC